MWNVPARCGFIHGQIRCEISQENRRYVLSKHTDTLPAVFLKCFGALLYPVPTFSVGLRYIYWEKCKGYKDNEFEEDESLFIEGPKYKDIKEELLESGHCHLFAYKVIEEKCKELMLCGDVKKMSANGYMTPWNSWYGINQADPITAVHVKCVVVYCDLTELSTAYSATFRSEFVGESLESMKERNQSFFHLSKGLREAVECFGKGIPVEKGPYYCGMNCLFLFSQFGIRLNGPTSTSKSRAVAIRFAGEHGVVLKMDTTDARTSCFDCVPFSQFPEEDERLFMGGRFQMMIQSILVMQTAQNFAHFFGVLSMFDIVIGGGYIYQWMIPPKKDHSKLEHLMKWWWGELGSEEMEYPEFVYQTFDCFRENKTVIKLSLFAINDHHAELRSFYGPLLRPLEEDKWHWQDKKRIGTDVNWKTLFGIFPNVNKIVISDCSWNGFGLPLSVFMQKLCDEVFPDYPKLEAVILEKIFCPAKEEEGLKKQADASKLQLVINRTRFKTTLSVTRM